MPTRTAKTAWTGTLQQGSGQVEMTSSGVGTYDVSFPKRAADDAGGTTSPEELIAAAHSACYAMSLSNEVAQAGGTPRSLDVQADVSLGPDPAGGFRLTGITLTVSGDVDGLRRCRVRSRGTGGKSGMPGQQSADRRRHHPERRDVIVSRHRAQPMRVRARVLATDRAAWLSRSVVRAWTQT